MKPIASSAPKKRPSLVALVTLLWLAAVVMLSAGPVNAAITYVGSTSNPADNNSRDTTAGTITPLTGMVAGDLVILIGNAREAAQTITMGTTGGQTWTALAANTTNTSQARFWARYNGTWSATPSLTFPSGANATTVVMHVFRPTQSINTWAIDVTQVNASFAAPASPYDVSAAITPATNGALVLATWASTDNNTWTLQSTAAGWANAGTSQYRNSDGSDSSQSSAYKIVPTAGSSASVTNRQTGNGPDAGNTSIVAFKEVFPPTITKSFSPASVPAYDASTMTITITNPNATTALSGLSFTDTYPANLVNSAAATASQCGGTVTGTSGGGSLALSGGSITAGNNCTVTVSVKSTTQGTYNNPPTAMSVTTTTGPTGTLAANAATLTVTAPTPVHCTSIASGNWDLPATWTNCRGWIPLAGDQVTIDTGHTVTLNVTTPILAAVTNKGTLNSSGTRLLSVGGNFANNGTLSLGSSSVDLYGDFANTTGASFNTGATDTGTWTFRGTALQNINSTGILTTFPNLTLNNTLGIALNASVTVKTLLTLTNGYISTGTNILTLSTSCATPSWTRTNGFVAGNVRLTFPSAASPGVTCTYPIGSGTNYAPIGLTMVSTGGTLTGSTTGYEHPAISASSIDPTLDANRYWTLGATGDSITAGSYGATFNFQTGDLDVNAYPAAFVVSQYAGGAWTAITTTTGTNSASISSVAGPIVIPTDFAIGQIPEPCTPPAGLPANMTCVCDNFGRTNLNPSTIYGADWVVDNKNQASTFGNPRIVNYGKLRLTDNSGGVATVANVPSTFPAAGNLIVVELKHYAYNGSGADGIAFTLSDATKAPTPGAFGGSLGYAPKSNPGSDCTTVGGCPGFNGGWVGIAIDEFGNFSNNTEGRTGGTAPGQRVDSVAVRGSGAGQTGYPYLAGSATLSPEIDNAASTSAARGYLYKFTVDARCYQSNTTGCTNPSLAKMTEVKVERDTGTGYTTVVPAFDAFAVNPSQADVPTNWKLSLTGSTGGNTNIHEVSGLKICAQTITPPAGYRIQVDNLLPSSCTTAPNGKPIVTITALDNAGNALTTYANPVTLSTHIGSPSGALSTTTTWTPQASNQGTWDSVNKRYTFHANDLGVAKFQLTDSATENIYITVSEYVTGSTLTSTLATPVQFSGGAFSVSIPDSLGAEVVAGRPHLLRITRTNGCGTDSSYVGAKTLDSWYTPATADHPGIAVAPQICATNAGGTCQPAGGSCQVQSIAPPALSSASNNLTLSFTAGIADFCLVTSDVGKYSINLRDDINIAAPIAGSTTTLTARPLALYFNSAAQAAITNPRTATPTSGTVFLPAGDTFMGTVSALLWNSTLDPGYTGTPTVTPQTNFSAWDSARASLTPSFAWPTTLAVASSGSPSAGTLGGASTSLASGAYANGSAVLPADSLWVDNVGSFLLTESVSNYLNTSGMTVPAYSDYVGRFSVDHFAISGSVTAACNGFTYMGQPNLGIQYTITAQNKKNTTTTNYSATPTITLVAEDEGTGNTGYDLGSRLSVPGTPAWVAGVYTVNSSAATFSRPTTLGPITGAIANAAGPFEQLQIGVRISNEPDNANANMLNMRATTTGACTTATAAATDCDATNIGATKLRFGVLRLENAYGSELLPIRVPVRMTYCNAVTGSNCTDWKTNTDDICTTLAASGGSLSYGTSGTPLSNASFRISGTDPNTGSGSTGNWMSTSSSITASGRATIILNRPCGAGASCTAATGSADLTLSVSDWLKGTWTSAGAWDENPVTRLKFGSSKAPYIYLRERY